MRRILNPPEVYNIMAQLCDVLAQIHEAGIVHRDLNPENIGKRSGYRYFGDCGICGTGAVRFYTVGRADRYLCAWRFNECDADRTFSGTADVLAGGTFRNADSEMSGN